MRFASWIVAMAHDVSYNFGTFEFGGPDLVGQFLQGRLRYWLSFARTVPLARSYQRENRSITIQRLALSPAQKRELERRLEVNALPENRDYRYDYFTDNCSTRVRDVIDGVLGGQLHAAARLPGELTLRGHALRMTADQPWLYVALLMVLGPATDRPIDRWAEDFLPEKLQQTMRGLRVPAPAGATGLGAAPPSVPLVALERVVFAADRPPVRRQPPRWGAWFLAGGMGFGGVLWALGGLARRTPRQGSSAPSAGTRAARVAMGAACVLLGLVAGGIGCFLLGAWWLTPHTAVYRNQNLLLVPPFLIFLVWFGGSLALGRPRRSRGILGIALVAAVLSVVAAGLKLLPAAVIAHQENADLIAFFMPVWAGLAMGARALGRAVTAPARAST